MVRLAHLKRKKVAFMTTRVRADRTCGPTVLILVKVDTFRNEDRSRRGFVHIPVKVDT